MDSTRSIFLIERMHEQGLPVMTVGGSGTAKTSTAVMYLLPLICQRDAQAHQFFERNNPDWIAKSIEGELDKEEAKITGRLKVKK